MTAVLHTEPQVLRGSIAAPQPTSTAAEPFADAASAILLLALALLHVRRTLECSAAHPSSEWMCTSDPFASWSFLPLHGLAALAGVAWACQAVRGGIGQAWRCCRRRAAAPADATSSRQLELFLACWFLCWFSPASPFAATRDCVDGDAQCASWATSGECEKNAAFMAKTCRAACGLCVRTSAGGPPSLPRVVTLGAGGLLLVVAAARLLLDGLGEATRRRLGRLAPLLFLPLRWLAGVVLRSPLGPTLLAAVRVLGGLLLRLRAVARPLSRVGAVVGGACANAFRRRLIVVLGGSLEEGGKGL